MVLLDSNIVIAGFDPNNDRAKEFIRSHDVGCSVITKVETLGYTRLSESDRLAFDAFFSSIPLYAVSDAVVTQAILLRQQRNIRLGDALIAATAIVHGLAIVTRNVSDFRWIESLRVIDPYASAE